MNRVILKTGLVALVIFLTACSGDSNPGYEFMPNMYRSPSLETYGENNINGMNALTPVEGTIARGKLSTFSFTGGYKLSDRDILINYMEEEIGLDGNPIDIKNGEEPIKLESLEGISTYPSDFNKDKKTLNQGEELYGMFCKHCHGKTGAGDGTMTHDIYSNVPHYNDSITKRRCNLPMCDLKAGHIFHAITYGLNAMGPHASQITEEERWKIVLYVQEELQHYGLE